MSSKIDFEKTMEELEKIVEKMENGDMTLDESIKWFQKGMELSRLCSKRLDEVEKKITILLEDENGKLTEKSFIEQEDINGV